MKSCIYCGNTLEDQAQFCNVCGQRQPAPQYQAPQYQQPQYQQPQYQQPQYQAPQYQQPQYQAPQYQQPQYRAPYAPVRPASPNFVPPVNTIGLFTCLAAMAVYLLNIVVNLIVPIMGIKLYASPLYTIFDIVLQGAYIGIAMIGFVVYNGKCKLQPKANLSVLWVGIPWGIRFIFGRLTGFLSSALANVMLMEIGMPAATYGIITFIFGLFMLAVNIALTWILTCVILKAVVRNQMK